MSFNPLAHTLQTTRTARYFASAPITAHTCELWIVLHGYAQHAGYFLKKFEPLFSDHKVFVAPEGLSRFYVKGSAGKVGASWMTSENREDEIADYVNYLDAILAQLNPGPQVKLNVLGFSQGAATLARWVTMGKCIPHHVIFYAGVFPPDVDPGFWQSRWTDLQVSVFMGNDDPFYPGSDVKPAFDKLLQVNPQTRFTPFTGGHEIIPGVLRHI